MTPFKLTDAQLDAAFKDSASAETPRSSALDLTRSTIPSLNTGDMAPGEGTSGSHARQRLEPGLFSPDVVCSCHAARDARLGRYECAGFDCALCFGDGACERASSNQERK